MPEIMCAKTGNIELLGYLKLKDHQYNTANLIDAIESTIGLSSNNGSIQYVNQLPTSNISTTTMYVIGDVINLYNGNDWISITGKSIKNIPITNQNDITTDYTITWNNNIVTITHNMNSRLICSLYDNNNNQVFLGVNYIDNNNCYIDFTDVVINDNETYMISLISQQAYISNNNPTNLDLAIIATTGSYNDLLNKPLIPTKTSQLANDSGFITQANTTASKLTNAIILQLSGKVNGSVEFDGSQNVDITTTLSNSGVNSGEYGPTNTTSNVTSGDTLNIPYLVVDQSGIITSAINKSITLPSSSPKLTTARTITLSGDVIGSVGFDGSQNVTIMTNISSSLLFDYSKITNKPMLSTVAITGSYNDLLNKPNLTDVTISTANVYNALNIDSTSGSTTKYLSERGTFIDIPIAVTKTSDLTNDSGFITQSTDINVTNTLNMTTKAYITGTTINTTNTGTQIFDTGVYLGTEAGSLYANMFYGSVTGNLIGTASKASADENGNNIVNTYGLKQQYVKQVSYTTDSTSISVSNEIPIYIYSIPISSATTFTFTWPDTTNIYTIELWLNMTTTSTLTLTGITWIEDPDFSNTGIYCICLRKMPSSFGSSAVYANIAYCV